MMSQEYTSVDENTFVCDALDRSVSSVGHASVVSKIIDAGLDINDAALLYVEAQGPPVLRDVDPLADHISNYQTRKQPITLYNTQDSDSVLPRSESVTGSPASRADNKAAKRKQKQQTYLRHSKTKTHKEPSSSIVAPSKGL